MRLALSIFCMAIAIWLGPAPAGPPPETPPAETPPAETQPPETPPQADAGDQARIHKMGPGFYQIGNVVLNSEARTVRCPGRVNMTEGGPIELMACLPRGKTHESVLTLDIEPKHLQVALLLLGMKEGRNPAVRYPEESPERQRPPGDEALISVEWRDPAAKPDAKPSRLRAEKLLFNVEADTPQAEATWVFLGSRVTDGRFGADLDGSLITTYHDPLAILELCAATANDDIYYIVNKELCPPIGTPVELIVEVPEKDKQADQKQKPAEQKQ